jgi:hypothetical protein
MLVQQAKMALAESAIEVIYTGKKQFASIIIDADGGAGASPLVSLGVSDTNQATAQSNVQAAFTGATSSTMEDLIVAISNFSYGTPGPLGNGAETDMYVAKGDFKCRIKNALKNETIYHATVAKFVDDAGATNLVGYGYYQCLVWDNDADGVGCVTLRIPAPAKGKGQVAIRQILGLTEKSAGVQITNGLTRILYDEDSNILFTVSMATPTDAGMKYEPIEAVVFSGPVILRDVALNLATNYGDVDYTNTYVLWAYPPNVQ